MSSMQMSRPEQSEHAPFHARYIDLVPETEIFLSLEEQIRHLRQLCGDLSEDQSNCLHQPYTWTIQQVIGHCIDAERVFGYRLARAIAGDTTPLAGFDENAYVANMDYETCTLGDLIDEWEHVRRGTLALLRRSGRATFDFQSHVDGQHVTVRAWAFLLVGHLRHHLLIIQRRLNPDYSSAAER